FLDLPAELRNHVYEFAAKTAVNKECCVLPCLTLALACSQLRTEYLPICRKVPLTINWGDVPRYLDAFHPTIKGQVQNCEQASATMRILTDHFTRNGQSVTIDLLILVKISLAQTTFTCQFVRSEAGEAAAGEEEITYLRGDSGVLQVLMQHRDEQWVQDIQSGKVVRISITPIGMSEDPAFQIHQLHDERSRHLAELGYAYDEDEPRYFEVVGLDDVWYHEEGYDSLYPEICRVHAVKKQV
ncbi:hypothetical protein CC86DRAFT_425332, partial [Ophiobolus disseminans]